MGLRGEGGCNPFHSCERHILPRLFLFSSAGYKMEIDLEELLSPRQDHEMESPRHPWNQDIMPECLHPDIVHGVAGIVASALSDPRKQVFGGNSEASSSTAEQEPNISDIRPIPTYSLHRNEEVQDVQMKDAGMEHEKPVPAGNIQPSKYNYIGEEDWERAKALAAQKATKLKEVTTDLRYTGRESLRFFRCHLRALRSAVPPVQPSAQPSVIVVVSCTECVGISFENMIIEDLGGESNTKLVEMKGCQDISFTGCIFHGPNQKPAVCIGKGCKNITFERCTFLNASVGICEGCTGISFSECNFSQHVGGVHVSSNYNVEVPSICTGGAALVVWANSVTELCKCSFTLQDARCDPLPKLPLLISMVLVNCGQAVMKECNFTNLFQNEKLKKLGNGKETAEKKITALVACYMTRGDANVNDADNSRVGILDIKGKTFFSGGEHSFRVKSNGKLQVEGVHFPYGTSIQALPKSSLEFQGCAFDVSRWNYPIITTCADEVIPLLKKYPKLRAQQWDIRLYFSDTTLNVPTMNGKVTNVQCGLIQHKDVVVWNPKHDPSFKPLVLHVTFLGNLHFTFEEFQNAVKDCKNGIDIAKIAEMKLRSIWNTPLIARRQHEEEKCSDINLKNECTVSIQGFSQNALSTERGERILQDLVKGLFKSRWTLEDVQDAAGQAVCKGNNHGNTHGNNHGNNSSKKAVYQEILDLTGDP